MWKCFTEPFVKFNLKTARHFEDSKIQTLCRLTFHKVWDFHDVECTHSHQQKKTKQKQTNRNTEKLLNYVLISKISQGIWIFQKAPKQRHLIKKKWQLGFRFLLSWIFIQLNCLYFIFNDDVKQKYDLHFSSKQKKIKCNYTYYYFFISNWFISN